MSLLDDQDNIIAKSDEIIRLKSIIAEKDKQIERFKEYFDTIHEENAKLKQELSKAHMSSRWVNNDYGYLLEPDRVHKMSIIDFDYDIYDI